MSDKPGGRKRSAAELGENDKEENARLRKEPATIKQQREQQPALRNPQIEQQLATMEQQIAASNQQREQQPAASSEQKDQQLATMKQQLAASNQQREQLAAINEQKNQQLATMEQQLAASNQQREQQPAASSEQKDQQLATMKQQLAASNQQREQLAASNEQKDQQLAVSNQQLAVSNQQLAVSNQQLAASKQRNQHFEKNSIHALLNSERTGNNNEGLFTLKCQGNDTSHTTSNSHLPAKTKSIHFELELVVLTEEMKDQTSMLMTMLDDCRGVIQFQSEADISRYTSNALRDAIKIVSLATKIRLNYRHEQSIFSQRPDHVVVYDVESNLPIIAVEDKKPASGGILTKRTAGQVFDYAVSMQSFGHKAPFVVLSSVEETYVTWLDESLPQDLAAGRGRIQAVSRNGSSPSVERSANALNQVDKTPSPPYLINEGYCPPQAQVSLRSQTPSGSQQLMFQADAERELCSSTDVYNSSQLTRVFYSVILCGLQGLDRSSAKSITRFTPPLACAKHCLELSEDSYGWGTILSKKRRTRLKESRKKKYYVVGVIGNGNTSNVFHAVDLDCKEYAIKMYVKRFDGNTHLTKKEFEENGQKSVTTEVKNFNSIYPNLNVFCQKLNKHHCVVMPFFDPVPKEQREGFIEKIEKVLKVFASNKLKYKDEDVRWRHVGLYEGKCILYDLAELKASRNNGFVAKHVKEFKSRANIVPRSSNNPQAFVIKP